MPLVEPCSQGRTDYPGSQAESFSAPSLCQVTRAASAPPSLFATLSVPSAALNSPAGTWAPRHLFGRGGAASSLRLVEGKRWPCAC